ncbi:MAG: S41 family peptidase [Planctomycetota bacterium]
MPADHPAVLALSRTACLATLAMWSWHAPLRAQSVAEPAQETAWAAYQTAPSRASAYFAGGLRAYRDKDYNKSVANYCKGLLLRPDSPTEAYNAACSAARSGQPDLAFALLAHAFDAGWLNAPHLRKDTDLEALHGDARWQAAMARASQAENAVATRWQSTAFETRFRENISTSDKAAGAARLWSEVKYNFAHFDQVPELDWDQAYMDALPKVLAAPTTYAYYRELQRLVAKLHDGHSNVYLPSQLRSTMCTPGLATRLVEGRVLAVAVYDRDLLEAGLIVGSEITAINGVDVVTYANDNVAPFVCASTKQDRARRMFGSDLLRGSQQETVELTFVAADGAQPTVVTAARQSRLAAGMRRFAQPDVQFESLGDSGVGYLALNSFGNSASVRKFVSLLPKIQATKGLVIDLRKNGGGNSAVGWEILSYFSKRAFATTRWHTLQYRPTMRAWGRQPITRYTRTLPVYDKVKPNTYDKPVVLLIGPQTFSAAEDMAAAFDQLGRGKMIGTATGGSTGQPLPFDLPGGGSARVCTKHDFYADGTEFVGIGIQPDLVVAPTIADVRAGVDTVLQAARDELGAPGK